ncbi:uncharacterized protein FOMMEDRAFT_114485 [Fomitiporia mediterranea MF3/22]|uniref:uncharacterized protein n=1 Tax=Fomitiporia mediterranea (strain MF3/22) TaxID=694068 RepID=UPI0004407798|nr:uncharacterized protein FOMMEDRAFT_114485 [Fomitiporia mediterranea MF3/22]EJC98289.1 hypothetical protein FOMMEDRAFT_114485 [Fomitiporia mediterranea MF3/22]
MAIAKCYDSRLSAIAAGYGGINIDRVDETETTTVWIGCKVALIDSFHVLLERILNQVRADPRTHAERAFGILFALLNLPSASSQSSVRPTPFLNRTLVADYQDACGLSSTLASVLSNNDDPRLDVLEATLKSFETEIDNDNKAGALRVVLRSNGVPPGIDNRGVSAKGKDRAAPEPEPIPGIELDAAVSSVLDILPDQDPGYVRDLLALPRYDGNAERIVAALLEGDAPPPSTLRTESETVPAPVLHAPLPERRNVFNEQPIEATTVNIGKRRGDADVVLQDRAFLDQMKADILRRAAELSDSDGEEVDAEDEDLESVLDGAVKVIGDGEGSGEGSEEDEEGEGEAQAPAPPQTPETICELAYIKDPSVFDRDSFTRRSKSRADLKAQTGWSDEQLEGWRIMLEKSPKKDKILQKHEFAGNKKGLIPGSSSGQTGGSSRGGRGRGRGRGGPGRGRGRGGRGGGESAKGDGGDARERAWKDKNKARQANHNRKRGHDRKMARGGAIPGPST